MKSIFIVHRCISGRRNSRKLACKFPEKTAVRCGAVVVWLVCLLSGRLADTSLVVCLLLCHVCVALFCDLTVSLLGVR